MIPEISSTVSQAASERQVGVSPAVTGIAGLGAHFAFETGDAARAAGSWRPLSALLDGSPALGERYEKTRVALAPGAAGEVPWRVAVSVGHLALVARWLCPTIAAAVFGYRLDLESAYWQPVLGVMPLMLPVDAITPGSSIGDVLDGPIEMLRERTSAFSLSRKILDGNVASAVNGAVMSIARVRPDLTEDAISVGRAVLSTVGPDFRRASCCLIYQISPAGQPSYCGDCVLPSGR